VGLPELKTIREETLTKHVGFVLYALLKKAKK